MLEHLINIFELKEDGFYYKSGRFKGNKAGSLVRGSQIVRVKNKDYLVKELVYYYHHGYFSDDQLTNADGDPKNNGILNLLEEGETYVRLNSGIRYDPATKQFMVRKYEENSLRHYYEVLDDYDFM